MAASSARMRLTVEVLPLVAENAHGPYQAAALAAFKGRKFALPVQLEHSFEQVWSQIEERYKRNYLTPLQASSFTIKKLQDAYDCDLDLSDTVGSIFEGENDAQMRMIKVVPSFVNRDFSVPVTSNLRPHNAPKRPRELSEEEASKRRRLEQEHHDLMDVDPTRDRPVPSTESENSGDEDAESTNGRAGVNGIRGRRSKSGASIVFVQDMHTGHEEFRSQVKEESPELGLPPPRVIPESPQVPFKKPLLPASRMSHAVRQHTHSPSNSRRTPSKEVRNHFFEEAAHGNDRQVEDGTILGDEGAQVETEPASSRRENTDDAAILQSPKSTPGHPGTLPLEAARRKNVYDTPSSPPFIGVRAKPRRTYGRSPQTPKVIEKEVDLLNNSRSRSRSTQGQKSGQGDSRTTLTSKARSFQLPKPDAIESTPQEDAASRTDHTHDSDVDLRANINGSTEDHVDDTNTPEDLSLPRSTKKGSLKRPAQRAYVIPPSTKNAPIQQSKQLNQTPTMMRRRTVSDARSNGTSASGTTNSTNKSTISSSMQARIDSMKKRLRTSPRVVIPPSRSPSLANQARPDSQASHRSSTPLPAGKPLPPREASIEATNSSHGFKKPPPKEAMSAETAPDHSVGNNRESSVTRRAPRRSLVPLPDNVKQHSSKVAAQSTARAPTPKLSQSSAMSAPPDKQKTESPSRRETDSPSNVPLSAFARPDSSVRQLSEASESRSTPRRSAVPLPENVRHLQGASPRTIKSYAAPPVKAKNPPGRRPANVVAAIKAEKDASPRLSKQAEIAQSPPVAGSALGRDAKAAIVLSSGSEYSESSDSEEDEEQEKPQTRQLVENEVPGSLEGEERAEQTEIIPDESRENEVHSISAGGAELLNDANMEEQTCEDEETQLDTTQEDKANVVSADEAQSLPNADVGGASSEEEEQSQPENPLVMGLAKASESSSSRAGTPDLADEQLAAENTASKTAPWNSESWGFDGVQQHEADDKADEEMVPQPHPASASGSERATESESEAEEHSKSKSRSPANSTRSSPAVSRRPARFLSHSPTPEKSSSGEQSVASRSQSRAASSKASSRNDDSDSSSSEGSGDSDSGSDSDSDVEMADAEKFAPPAVAADPPSSPPPLPQPQLSKAPTTQSSQFQTSQSLPRKSQVPLPKTPVLSQNQTQRTQTSTSFPSSQSISELAARNRPTYKKFPSIKQQLAKTQAQKEETKQKNTFDPRTSSLGRLSKKKGKMGPFEESDSDSEEESSSSSSEDEGVKNGGVCSVA